MSSKSYRQFCGLARALDVVGHRWNLLIVRELLIGPRRFGELAAGLPGIATNILAERLRELERDGVIERRLAVPRGVDYALTTWGSALREPIEAIIRWSAPLMASGPRRDDTSAPGWLAVALRALLAGARARRRVDADLDVDGERLHISVSAAGPDVTLVHASPDTADASGSLVLSTTAWICLGLFTGDLDPRQAEAAGLLTGDLDALMRVLATRRPPEARTGRTTRQASAAADGAR